MTSLVQAQLLLMFTAFAIPIITINYRNLPGSFLPTAASQVGTAVALLGVLLWLWILASFSSLVFAFIKDVRTKNQTPIDRKTFETMGPFKYIQSPRRFGVLLILNGITLISGNLAAAIVVTFLVFYADLLDYREDIKICENIDRAAKMMRMNPTVRDMRARFIPLIY
jgi:protein-S-isoprenylcysteine O-methyltransferase Ste14